VQWLVHSPKVKQFVLADSTRQTRSPTARSSSRLPLVDSVHRILSPEIAATTGELTASKSEKTNSSLPSQKSTQLVSRSSSSSTPALDPSRIVPRADGTMYLDRHFTDASRSSKCVSHLSRSFLPSWSSSLVHYLCLTRFSMMA
jgi:hypothetical protein